MSHRRILIVDDDEAIRSVLADLFRDEGYTVKTACNGRQALAAVERNVYDVLLTDLDMPDGNGLELARALHGQNSTIPLVVMAASRSGAATSREMDAVAYLQKPFDIETVISTIDAVVSPESDAPGG